jgi:hypothetical protein
MTPSEKEYSMMSKENEEQAQPYRGEKICPEELPAPILSSASSH